MGYYDSVKDSVKDDERGANSARGNFDTLKENAEENTKPDEEKGDDTPIEVVEEGGISRETPSKNQKRSNQQSQQEKRGQKNGDNPFTSDSKGSTGTSGVEEKLDRIIEQNERMIEILESFGS